MSYFDLLMSHKSEGLALDGPYLDCAEQFIREESNPIEQRAEIVKKYNECYHDRTVGDTPVEIVAHFISEMDE